MFRTVLNVWGDACALLVVDHLASKHLEKLDEQALVVPEGCPPPPNLHLELRMPLQPSPPAMVTVLAITSFEHLLEFQVSGWMVSFGPESSRQESPAGKRMQLVQNGDWLGKEMAVVNIGMPTIFISICGMLPPKNNVISRHKFCCFIWHT